MANFVNSSGKPIDRVSVLLNTTLKVGVWGPLYGPDWTVEYKVEPDAGSVALVSVAKTQQGGKEKPITGKLRRFGPETPQFRRACLLRPRVSS